ncbi:MAG: glycosyltransferase family 9 protein [Desulfobacterales bacterium]|nr:glycosyltransferase family 9 protein [Desulfobacterales bacterium]
MKKILIIKMSALGDVLMALPHVDSILAQHRDDDVWLLTGPAFRELFVNHPRLKVIALDRRKGIGAESTYGRALWVRKQAFDGIYDLQGNRTSRLLVRFSKSPWRVGTQPLRIYHFHPEDFYRQDTPQHVFDRLNETIAAAGLEPARPEAVLYPSPDDITRVVRWKTEQGLADGSFALMHAGSSSDWPSKRWPAEYFLELARRLEASGRRCVWIGGDADREINSGLAREVGMDATGRFSILQLYELGRAAAFAVTNDSGPMHILALSGLPVYAFFGPTNWFRSHAVGQPQRVLTSPVDCSPCFLGRCPPAKAHACLRNIGPEGVYLKIKAEQAL